jgi:hypothetical protein
MAFKTGNNWCCADFSGLVGYLEAVSNIPEKRD